MDKYLSAALLLALGHMSIETYADESVSPLESTAAAVAAYRSSNPAAHRPPGASRRSPDARRSRLALPPLPRTTDEGTRLSLPGDSAAH